MPSPTGLVAKSGFCVCLLLGACNVFNPSGKGDAGDDPDAQVSLGETLYRKQDFGGSMEAYARAIAKDSGNSMAYYGYAKATVQFYRLSPLTLLTEVQAAKDSGKIPFFDSPDTLKTQYLQCLSRVRWALAQLTARDTLTRWYRYSLDSTAAEPRHDASAAKRIAFIQDYFAAAAAGQAGYRPRGAFPLSDLRMGYDKVLGDYGVIELVYAVLHLQDLDANDTIDSRDDLISKLNFNLKDGFKVDSLDKIKDSLMAPETRKQVNQLIQNVSSGVGSAGTIVGLLGSLSGSGASGLGDSLSNQGLTNNLTGNLDSVVKSMGNTITFYQFGDGKDNDGDGCVDEEILDGKDNDGDGLVDEDARIPSKGGDPLADSVDNDHNGTVDEADEGVNPLDPDHRLLFTTKAGFVMGPKYKDAAFKAWVQADSGRTRSVIDSAKKEIGGCWKNY